MGARSWLGGEQDKCVFPGCEGRAKDARAFCHDHWVRLPGSIRRRISKLYSSSRRGHNRNPRQAQWERTISDGLLALGWMPDARTTLASREPEVVRVRDFVPEPIPVIAPEAREAIREINMTTTTTAGRRRTVPRATPEQRERLFRRMEGWSKEKLERVAREAGVSHESVRKLSTNTTLPDTSYMLAFAVEKALDALYPEQAAPEKATTNGEAKADRAGVDSGPNWKLAYKEWMLARYMENKPFPTLEEAFQGGWEWLTEELGGNPLEEAEQ